MGEGLADRMRVLREQDSAVVPPGRPHVPEAARRPSAPSATPPPDAPFRPPSLVMPAAFQAGLRDGGSARASATADGSVAVHISEAIAQDGRGRRPSEASASDGRGRRPRRLETALLVAVPGTDGVRMVRLMRNAATGEWFYEVDAGRNLDADALAVVQEVMQEIESR